MFVAFRVFHGDPKFLKCPSSPFMLISHSPPTLTSNIHHKKPHMLGDIWTIRVGTVLDISITRFVTLRTGKDRICGPLPCLRYHPLDGAH